MSTEAPRERSKLLTELDERRERHRQRPKVVRGLVVVAGLTVLLAGIAMLVLPGPALAVIPVGLALLALEFKWAEELLEKAIEQAEKAGTRAKETSRAERIVAAMAIALGIGAVVAWAIFGDIPLLPV